MDFWVPPISVLTGFDLIPTYCIWQLALFNTPAPKATERTSKPKYKTLSNTINAIEGRGIIAKFR